MQAKIDSSAPTPPKVPKIPAPSPPIRIYPRAKIDPNAPKPPKLVNIFYNPKSPKTRISYLTAKIAVFESNKAMLINVAVPVKNEIFKKALLLELDRCIADVKRAIQKIQQERL